MAPAPMTTIGSACGTEVKEEFLVAGCAGDRRWRHPDPRKTARVCRFGDAGDDGVVDRRVRHDAVLAHLVAAGLELRLHESHNVRCRIEKRRQRWKNVPKRDERD